MDKLKQILELLNGLSENCWAMLILSFALVLFLRHEQAAAGTLVTGALAIFQRKA